MSDHPYRILIIRGCGSGKTNALSHLLKQQDDDNYIVIDKIMQTVQIKNLNYAKYQ